MRKESFNEYWHVESLTDKGFLPCEVTLPFDAMLGEQRTPNSEGGVNSAWFTGGDYRFSKRFGRIDLKEGETALLEFEGVYRDAEVFLNGKRLGGCNYGYRGFYVDLTLALEEENLLEVTCRNADQPNSRWYSGSGIYRPVWLYVLPKKHLLLDSLRVLTLDHRNGKVRLSAASNEDGTMSYSILDGANKEVLKGEIQSKERGFAAEFEIPEVKLWDEEHPNLYTLCVAFEGDKRSIRFGVRQIEWGPNGLLINGQRAYLRGACVHHDNGLLGAATYFDVEYRKLSLLKEAGYNAIRSAHNPIGKSFLEAADELGMYVLDEYVDCWYVHKTKYDYATRLQANWQEDIRAIVDKDYNHPCVIMYSSGNEVGETSEEKGIALTKAFTEHFHSLDPSRPVTCGINIFFNALYSMGFGVYSDKKAEKNDQAKAKKKEVGSAFFNSIANIAGSHVMKLGAKLHISDRKTRDAFANMDVAGYNYGIYRYRHDLRKYPNRLILGSETFCCDTWLWQAQAKGNSRIVGDFVWSGFDYLGECGIGAWMNEQDAPHFGHGKGWITAGAGRIDITGRFLGEALYTQVQYGKKDIALAVIPPLELKLKHSPSAWKYSLAMPYYDFPGQEGKKGVAEIYSKAEEVALFLNDKLIAKKRTHKSGTTKISFIYEPGELKAASYKNGKEVASTILKTGSGSSVLTLHSETSAPTPRDSLLFVRMRLGDASGNIRPYLKDRLKVKDIVGGKLLGLGNGSSYQEESFLGKECLTYQGEALAIFHVDDPAVFAFSVESQYGNASFRLSADE